MCRGASDLAIVVVTTFYRGVSDSDSSQTRGEHASQHP
jgi:hypothetical protein